MGMERKLRLPRAEEALPGRAETMRVPPVHFVNGHPLKGPFRGELAAGGVRHGLLLGRRAPLLADARRVHHGGRIRRWNHAESDVRRSVLRCTGHSEVVLVVFDPAIVSYEELLRVFWEAHDPTQGMRQGNDVGTQYRSVIYTYERRATRGGAPVASACSRTR